MEYSFRPGSCSDKNVWRICSSILPKGMHFLGDAGYTLSREVLVPCNIYDGMPAEEKTYNYIHSRTRITVECAFGMLKGRWRILKRVLNMKCPESIARTIIACMVLHNLTIDLRDDEPVNAHDEYVH